MWIVCHKLKPAKFLLPCKLKVRRRLIEIMRYESLRNIYLPCIGHKFMLDIEIKAQDKYEIITFIDPIVNEEYIIIVFLE